MPGAGKEHVLFNAVVFVAMEITAVVLLCNTVSLQDIWINRASHRVLAAMWGGGESLRNHFSLERQNRDLFVENASLGVRVREYERQKLARTHGSISDTVSGHFRYLPATIVKASRNSTHNYIILDKGKADGVAAGSGIITNKGAIGIVTAVDDRFCYGLTLMNPHMTVSARLGHTAVTPGDTVWTSGFSSIFPPGIPIGVTGKVRVVDGSVNEVDVHLFQDFGSMRFVTIVENMDRTAIERLEKEAAR